MKHVIVLAILAVTIPLAAAEHKETPPPAPATVKSQSDSPLVAAAKRAGRLNKKPAFVITNETLAQMTNGRLTTTSAQHEIAAPIVLPPLTPTPEMKSQQQRAQVQQSQEMRAGEQKKVEQERMSQAAQRAAQNENAYLDQDPAAAERAMEQMTSKSSEQPTSKPAERPPQR